MPSVSRETASEKIALEGLDVRLENLEGGYSVCFESHSADADLAELFRGLPDDRAQLPRTEVLGETIPVVMKNLQAAGVAIGSES